jgi:hypothetical protein
MRCKEEDSETLFYRIAVLAINTPPGNSSRLRRVVENRRYYGRSGRDKYEAAKRALLKDHLSSVIHRFLDFVSGEDSLEAFLDRTLLTLYEQSVFIGCGVTSYRRRVTDAERRTVAH